MNGILAREEGWPFLLELASAQLLDESTAPTADANEFKPRKKKEKKEEKKTDS